MSSRVTLTDTVLHLKKHNNILQDIAISLECGNIIRIFFGWELSTLRDWLKEFVLLYHPIRGNPKIGSDPPIWTPFWTPSGRHLDPLLDPHMDPIWTPCGPHLDPLWTPSGPQLDLLLNPSDGVQMGSKGGSSWGSRLGVHFLYRPPKILTDYHTFPRALH